MTIAIGLLADDALILAADTEESYEFVKGNAFKIATSTIDSGSFVCGIAGAGHSDYIDIATGRLLDVFFMHNAKPPDALRGELENALTDFMIDT